MMETKTQEVSLRETTVAGVVERTGAEREVKGRS
jgi:hypothetical protein